MSHCMLAATGADAYLPIAIVFVMAAIFAVVNLVASQLLGPRASGATKGIAYESGMDPFSSARKKFNIRFYVLAMTFLVFDVEIIFLFPRPRCSWVASCSSSAPAWSRTSTRGARACSAGTDASRAHARDRFPTVDSTCPHRASAVA